MLRAGSSTWDSSRSVPATESTFAQVTRELSRSWRTKPLGSLGSSRAPYLPGRGLFTSGDWGCSGRASRQAFVTAPPFADRYGGSLGPSDFDDSRRFDFGVHAQSARQ